MSNKIILKKILKDNPTKQFSSEELFLEAKKQNPSLRKETVYTALKKITKKGLVEKVRGLKAYYVWRGE